jgi:hypothetical protein
MILNDSHQFDPITPKQPDRLDMRDMYAHSTSMGSIVLVVVLAVAAVVTCSYLYMKNQADAPTLTSYSTEQKVPDQIDDQNAEQAETAIDSDFAASEADFDKAMMEMDAELGSY